MLLFIPFISRFYSDTLCLHNVTKLIPKKTSAIRIYFKEMVDPRKKEVTSISRNIPMSLKLS